MKKVEGTSLRFLSLQGGQFQIVDVFFHFFRHEKTLALDPAGAHMVALICDRNGGDAFITQTGDEQTAAGAESICIGKNVDRCGAFVDANDLVRTLEAQQTHVLRVIHGHIGILIEGDIGISGKILYGNWPLFTVNATLILDHSDTEKVYH